MSNLANSADTANRIGLKEEELNSILQTLHSHPAIKEAKVFGSRAKGTQRHNSDIDLCLSGLLDPIQTQAIAAKLDELPLAYQFSVIHYESLQNDALVEHIQRVGITIYQSDKA